MGPVLEDDECGLKEAGGIGRDRKLVDGLIEVRRGVEVRAEAYADRLQVLHQIVLLEVGRAVERGVLDEVRVALLIIVLEHGAGVHGQTEFGAFRWQGVLPDVVAHAVRERPGDELGSDAEWLRQRRRCAGLLSDQRKGDTGGEREHEK